MQIRILKNCLKVFKNSALMHHQSHDDHNNVTFILCSTPIVPFAKTTGVGTVEPTANIAACGD